MRACRDRKELQGRQNKNRRDSNADGNKEGQTDDGKMGGKGSRRIKRTKNMVSVSRETNKKGAETGGDDD
jgi:hypothetical protein